MTAAQLATMTKLKGRGRSYREIGAQYGLTAQRIYQLLKSEGLPPRLSLFEIDSAPVMRTWLAQSGRLHLHAHTTPAKTWHWLVVQRQTVKCGTPKCLTIEFPSA